MTDKKPLHVAVGVITDSKGNILISHRHQSSHQGGLWEFPGGKVEQGETAQQALARELKEELGIVAQDFTPLIKINHQYSDLSVLLDTFTVSTVTNIAQGLEGQAIKWVRPDQLIDYQFPAANYSIITAARLPCEYAILNGADLDQLLQDLRTILQQGVTLIQARVKALSSKETEEFFKQAIPLCQEKSANILVNSAVKHSHKIDVAGVHLTSNDLLSFTKRPAGYIWVAASCHNAQELAYAEKIGVDFVVLAPVCNTQTHPTVKPMGWDEFERLSNSINLPVFALGGLKRADKLLAQQKGAQGISGISTFVRV